MKYEEVINNIRPYMEEAKIHDKESKRYSEESKNIDVELGKVEKAIKELEDLGEVGKSEVSRAMNKKASLMSKKVKLENKSKSELAVADKVVREAKKEIKEAKKDFSSKIDKCTEELGVREETIKRCKNQMLSLKEDGKDKKYKATNEYVRTVIKEKKEIARERTELINQYREEKPKLDKLENLLELSKLEELEKEIEKVQTREQEQEQEEQEQEEQEQEEQEEQEQEQEEQEQEEQEQEEQEQEEQEQPVQEEQTQEKTTKTEPEAKGTAYTGKPIASIERNYFESDEIEFIDSNEMDLLSSRDKEVLNDENSQEHKELVKLKEYMKSKCMDEIKQKYSEEEYTVEEDNKKLDDKILLAFAKLGRRQEMRQYIEAIYSKEAEMPFNLTYDLAGIYESGRSIAEIRKINKIAKIAQKQNKGKVEVYKDSLLDRIKGNLKLRLSEFRNNRNELKAAKEQKLLSESNEKEIPDAEFVDIEEPKKTNTKQSFVPTFSQECMEVLEAKTAVGMAMKFSFAKMSGVTFSKEEIKAIEDKIEELSNIEKQQQETGTKSKEAPEVENTIEEEEELPF